MRRLAAVSLAVALIAVFTAPAPAANVHLEKTLARFEGVPVPYGLSIDCTLNAANLCAGWIWTFTAPEGAVWGSVLTAADCPIGCMSGGAVNQIILYSRCTTAPGQLDHVGVSTVDGVGCRTSLLYQSPPLSIVHCVSGDRWTTIQTPHTSVSGNPFVVTVTWGPQIGGTSNPQLATDNGIANLYCKNNPSIFGVFPGCATSTSDCSAWVLPPQRTYIYVTDLNGDTVLDDICALYGAPYPLAFPYVYPYGYLPNNLIISVGLDCYATSPTENTSWGGVKALFR